MKSRISQADSRLEQRSRSGVPVLKEQKKQFQKHLYRRFYSLQVTAALQPEFPALSHSWGHSLELFLSTLSVLQGQLQPGLLQSPSKRVWDPNLSEENTLETSVFLVELLKNLFFL